MDPDIDRKMLRQLGSTKREHSTNVWPSSLNYVM